MWGEKENTGLYVHRDVQKTSSVQNKSVNKELWGKEEEKDTQKSYY